MEIAFTIRWKPGAKEMLRDLVRQAMQMAVDGWSEAQIKSYIRRQVKRGLEISQQ
jgi:hypothetical protein